MKAVQAQPMNWQVNGLNLAGLSWNNTAAKPLLALHGWLDNAASFNLLAPLLGDYHVVALDLTGHGRSDHRSADATYQIWDDLPEILGVVDALGWGTFTLLGHSRGAFISTLLAGSFPERVQQLVLLDGVSPGPVAEGEFPGQMRKFIQEKRHWQGSSQRVFGSVAAAASSRIHAGMPEAAAMELIQRNLAPCEGGFSWTTDPRLRGASAVKLTAGHIQAVWQALSMPTLLLLADDGIATQRERGSAWAQQYIDDLQVDTISGGHHFHMEACVDIVAARITQFLQDQDNREAYVS
jgi:pimeloyl-ACP methyl ester carboxylesterase